MANRKYWISGLIVVIVLLSGCVREENVPVNNIEQPIPPHAEIQSAEQETETDADTENGTVLVTADTDRGSDQELEDAQPLPEPDADETGGDDRPVLKNLGFDIEPWDRDTDLAGDLLFTEDLVFEDDYIVSEWVFVEFGGQGQRKNDPNKNIEYWFFVPVGTDVKAPITGIVDVAFVEHTQDWGINFYTGENSEWIVSYEHVVDVNVNDGDTVEAGEVVAKAAPRINDNIAMTELAVWRGGQNIYKYCPFDFLDETLKPVYEEKITRLASDWEQYIGQDVYEQERWVAPGCLVHNITER